MAATSQRPGGKRGKQPQSGHYHAGHRLSGNGNKEHFTQHPMTSSMSSSNLPGVYSNPDMAYALVGIVGCVVDVQMQSGMAYQGVLKAVSPQLSMALALAHDKKKEASPENTEKLMQLEFADIVSVSVLPDSNPSLNTKDIFKTDAEISRTNGASLSRELQPFTFDEDSSSLTALIDSNAGTDTGWTAEDMFETNKSKFQVESSYDEEMPQYTTKLDRSETKDFQRRQDRAARLAREIEGSSERYRMEEEEEEEREGGTEEELFSSVVRQQVAVATHPSSIPRPLPKHTHPTATPTSQPPAQSGPIENRTTLKCPESGGVGPDTDPTPSRIGSSYSSPSLTSSWQSKETAGEDSREAAVVEGGGPGTGEAGTTVGTGVTTTTTGGGGGVTTTEVDEAAETSEEVIGMTPPIEGGAEAEKEMPPNIDKTTPPTVTAADKDTANQDKPGLDPNAKVFVPSFLPITSSSSSSTSTTSGIPQSSSAPAVIDSPHYLPPSTSHLAGKFTKRNRGHAPMTFTPQDPISYVSAAPGGGYMITQATTPQLAVMRTPLQQVPSGQLIQYSTGIPQFAQPYGGGYITQQSLTSPQHYTDVSSQQQIYASTQQYPVHLNPHQLISPSHGQTTPTNQSGLVANPQVMLIQGGGAGSGGPSVSGYPHTQVAGYIPQVGQNQVVTQNRYIYSTQQPPN